ncbi:MAG: transposase [Woeseiaceae bacterium]
MRERFYLWRHVKALRGKGQDCQTFTPTRFFWNARHFILKRFRIQQRYISCLHRRQDHQDRLGFDPNAWLSLVVERPGHLGRLQRRPAAQESTLERFFTEHRVRYAQVIRQRITDIRAALPLTSDKGVIDPNALMVEALVSQLRAALEAIRLFDQRIAEVANQHDDFTFFESLPGAGPVASRLLAAFGEQRQRYPEPGDLQRYAGIAPVTERSGNKTWIHWRLSCPKFLRQTFVEWAAQSIRQSFWARAFYEQQRAKGKSHQMALRALAFKWIRIPHRCWQNRTPYNETTYLNSLKKRGSPLLANLAAS